MDVPNAASVRQQAMNGAGVSSFDFDRYGYPAPTPPDPDALDTMVAVVVGWVENITARKLDSSLTDPGLVALAGECVMLRTEQQLVKRGDTRKTRDSVERSLIDTLRAGDFSVTYSGGSTGRRGAEFTPELNDWDSLSEALLALATPDRRAQLLAERRGVNLPQGLTVNAGSGYGPGYGSIGYGVGF